MRILDFLSLENIIERYENVSLSKKANKWNGFKYEPGNDILSAFEEDEE